MAKFNYLQNTFSSGELGGKLKARTDAKEYLQGCEKLLNFLPMVSGGVARKPGFYFGWEVPDASLLIPFKFDSDNQYIIAVNATTSQASHANRIRIYKAEQNGNGIGTLCTVVSTSTLTLFELSSIYDIQWAQSGDLMFLVDSTGNKRPLVIGRTGATEFTIAVYIDGAFTNGYGSAGVMSGFMNLPYLDYNTDTTKTLTMSATTGTITVTASWSNFTSDFVGAYYKINTAGVTTVVEFTAYISATQMTAEVRQSATGATTSATNYWAKGAWSADLGYPKTVCIHQQRIIFGGNKTYPNTIWCSATGNLFLMMQEKLLQDATTDNSTNRYYGARAESDPFSFAIAHTEDNAITWLASMNGLMIGTTGEEFSASNVDGVFGYRNINVQSSSSVGSYRLKPHKIDNSLLFVSANRNAIHALKYSDEAGGHQPTNLSVLNDEISKYGASQSTGYNYNSIGYINSAYLKDAKSLFLVNNMGKLISMTFDESFEVRGWAKHEIGKNGSDVICYSVADAIAPFSSSLSGITTTVYNGMLFACIKRTINGGTKYYIEAMNPIFDNDIIAPTVTGIPFVEYPIFLDCSEVSQLGAASVTHSGFSHLLNETVHVVADGVYIGTKVVSNAGVITLDTAAHSVIAGYNYTSTLKTMPLEAGAQTGSSMPALQRIDRVVARLFKSKGGEFGNSESNLLDLELTTQQTVDKKLDFYSTPDTIQQVCLVQDEPYPMTILGLGMRGVTHD